MRIGGFIANSTNNEAHLQLTGDPTVAAPVNGDVWLNGATFNARLSGTTHNLAAPSNLTIASQAQGDILYYNGTIWTRLGAGTAGQVLRTEGAGANPTFGYPADLTIASQAHGDILYRNATNWVRLAAGTSGQFLRTNGAAANPSWATAGGGLTLLSTTSGTAANSGDITIAPDKNYLVVATIQGTGNDVLLRFNNDSGAADYHWVRETLTQETTPTQTLVGDSDDSEIELGIVGNAEEGHLEMFINTYNNSAANDQATVRGWMWTNDDTDKVGVTFYGGYDDSAATVSSFRFEFTGAGTVFIIRVYEFAQ